MTFWIDVEDLFEYALVNPRPSGIQRLSFELYRALLAQRPGQIAFCRHDRIRDTLRVVPWSTVEALFLALTAPESGPRRPAATQPQYQQAAVPSGGVRRLASRLPADIRLPLGEAMRNQAATLRAALRAGSGMVAALRRSLHPVQTQAGIEAMPGGTDLKDLAKPGDMLLVLGSPWFRTDYGALLGRVKQACGLRVALLIYDLIPLSRPEFCDQGLVRTFDAWIASTLPVVDRLFAISRASARDMEALAPRLGLTLPGAVIPVPVGTGFGQPADAASAGEPADAASAGQPADASNGRSARIQALPPGYVLLVSTIEARKNHLLAFRAWRHLLDQLPPEQVPTLVFAGRVGWMVADLMQQLENCQYLGGKIILLGDPDDAELAALYTGCRFTLFPSHYEGWGLPVTESLAFGKTCIASNATSIPEAGGDFCLYHDPENVLEAVAILRRVIENPAEIAALEERIRLEFRPVPWADTAIALLAGLEEARPGETKPRE